MLLLVFILFGPFGAASGQTTYAIELSPGVDPVEFGLSHGMEYVRHASVSKWHIFTSVATDVLHSLNSDVRIVSKHVQSKRVHHTRSGLLGDPLYEQQWHLHNSPYSVDQPPAGGGPQGAGVTVAIVDDGLQHSHPDLTANYSPGLSYDFNDRDSDPSPNVYKNDGHGTSAAGVCGAVENNSHCGKGVAPRVTLAGIRLIARGTYDYEEAEGLSHKNNEIDIYSCSWGPSDTGDDMVAPGAITRDALEHNYAHGRNGKGSIYIWAGGNGRAEHDNGNYDGYANNIHTMAIGAIDANGAQSWYAEDCACLTAVTPSSGAPSGPSGAGGITTVDLTGPYGYASGECTNGFGGTSSAAPLAAGIVALVLEKHPTFTNRDVQHVVAKGSFQVNPMDPDWTPRNAQGVAHSHHYGFGLMKIPGLLDVANRHQLVPPQILIQSNTIAQTNAAPRNIPITFRSNVGMRYIEQVVLTLDASFPAGRGQVEISLIHERTGIVSKLALTRPDYNRNRFTWDYTSTRHWGYEHAPGDKWIVHLEGTVSNAIVYGGHLVLLGM